MNEGHLENVTIKKSTRLLQVLKTVSVRESSLRCLSHILAGHTIKQSYKVDDELLVFFLFDLIIKNTNNADTAPCF